MATPAEKREGNNQIDERYLVEWFEFGWSELLSYLAKWAAFRRYEEQEQEETA